MRRTRAESAKGAELPQARDRRRKRARNPCREMGRPARRAPGVLWLRRQRRRRRRRRSRTWRRGRRRRTWAARGACRSRSAPPAPSRPRPLASPRPWRRPPAPVQRRPAKRRPGTSGAAAEGPARTALRCVSPRSVGLVPALGISPAVLVFGARYLRRALPSPLRRAANFAAQGKFPREVAARRLRCKIFGGADSTLPGRSKRALDALIGETAVGIRQLFALFQKRLLHSSRQPARDGGGWLAAYYYAHCCDY